MPQRVGQAGSAREGKQQARDHGVSRARGRAHRHVQRGRERRPRGIDGQRALRA